jgi:hypothetical protein
VRPASRATRVKRWGGKVGDKRFEAENRDSVRASGHLEGEVSGRAGKNSIGVIIKW